MRAGELSIGDWCLYGQRYCIITKVSYDKVSILVNTGFQDEIIVETLDNIEPIPLTVEILEKNGFEMADDTYTRPTVFYFSKDRRVQFSNLTNSGDGYWCVHVDNEDFETIGSCDVQYVHLMQNFLRLCKYELDLKI